MTLEPDYLQSLGISTLGTRLRRLFENLNGGVAQLYREELGFEQRWFALTRLLDDSGALSIQTAANRLGTSHVSVLQVAKAMEGAGLLQRKKSPHDKRVALLSLTQDGTKIASQVLDISQRVDKAARGLIEAAAPDFIDHLTALENALQETPFAARIGEVAPQISTPKEKTSD